MNGTDESRSLNRDLNRNQNMLAIASHTDELKTHYR